MDSALSKLDGGHKRLSDRLEENTALTAQTKQSIDSLQLSLGGFPTFMTEGQQTFKFVKRLVNFVQWLLILFVAPVLGLIILTGHSPHWVRELWQLILEFNK